MAAERMLVQAIDLMCADVHRNAINKQFVQSGQQRNGAELVALIHSEASEVLEALRHGNPPDDKVPQFSGAEAELADVVIRCADMAAERGYRLGEAIVAKMQFNAARPAKHGGKQF